MKVILKELPKIQKIMRGSVIVTDTCRYLVADIGDYIEDLKFNFVLIDLTDGCNVLILTEDRCAELERKDSRFCFEESNRDDAEYVEQFEMDAWLGVIQYLFNEEIERIIPPDSITLNEV